jgi:hypothetical protein
MSDEVLDQPTEVVDIAPVETVETVETPEISTETPETPAAPSYGSRVKALSGKAKERYQLSGDLDAAEAIQRKVSAKVTPAADKTAETEPAPGPGTQPQEQPRTRQDRNFRSLSEKASSLERDLIAAKAKLEVYERERAGSGPSAPATVKEQPQIANDDPRPDPTEYTDAKKWKDDDTAWINRQFDKRITGEQQRQQFQQSTEKWNGQLSDARKTYKDFDQVALNEQTPVSYAAMAHIQSLPDGALKSYALGKNLEVATKIAELTHIPGEHQFTTFTDFMKWVKSDPDRAMLYGEKLALAKAEIAKLQVGKVSAKAEGAPATVKPFKELIRSAARPSAEVTVDEPAQPLQDPIQRALQNIKNKVPGATKEYNRLRNEQDLRQRRGR